MGVLSRGRWGFIFVIALSITKPFLSNLRCATNYKNQCEVFGQSMPCEGHTILCTIGTTCTTNSNNVQCTTGQICVNGQCQVGK